METKIKLNYDTAFGEDNEMSQTDVHNNLIIYLMAVLTQLFTNQKIGIFTSIQLYGDPLYPGRPKSPDLLVIDNLVSMRDSEVSSYYISQLNSPPRFLMEVSSKDNWQEDVEYIYKLGSYERMGIPEYFACDPHPTQVWKHNWLQQGRLLGWRFDAPTRRFERIEPDVHGRLWSEELKSWLVMEGHEERELHLYDQQGILRLTPEQTERKLRLAAEQRIRELEEKLRQLENN